MPVSFFVGLVFVAVLVALWLGSLVVSAYNRRRYSSRWGSQLSAQDDAAARAARAGGGIGAGSAMTGHDLRP